MSTFFYNRQLTNMKSKTPLQTLLVIHLSALAAISGTVAAQDILNLKTGTITFFSSAPVEDIKAVNTTFTSAINLVDSSVVFSVPVAGFVFRKKLMQEHFNDQYMESSRFPTARFQGNLTRLPQPGPGSVPLQARVKGMLTIRDISRKIDETVTFTPDGNGIASVCEFMVRLADYDIKIPRILIKNIAEEVRVTVNVVYSSR